MLAPLAGEKSLAFEPPEQRIKRSFVDRQLILAQRLTQSISALLVTQSCQHSDHQAAPAQLQFKIFERVGNH